MLKKFLRYLYKFLGTWKEEFGINFDYEGEIKKRGDTVFVPNYFATVKAYRSFRLEDMYFANKELTSEDAEKVRRLALALACQVMEWWSNIEQGKKKHFVAQVVEESPGFYCLVWGHEV